MDTKQKIKAERFYNVAPKRVQKVLDDMDNLLKCANKRNYEYTDKEAKKIIKAIYDKYNELKVAYTSGVNAGKKTFQL
jgi:hypothetical protein